jgi:hypothetical protein
MLHNRIEKDPVRIVPHRIVLALVLTMAVAGCAPPQELTPAQRAEAEHLIDLARSFETTADLRRATDLYTSVAESYPHSDAGAEAAYKAGLLRVNPHNPVRNDTLALAWFHTAMTRPIAPDERDHTEVCIALLEHMDELRQDLDLHWRLADSLRSLARRQGVSIAAYQRRNQELEQQLFASTVELKKLKDVDIRIARSRQRR